MTGEYKHWIAPVRRKEAGGVAPGTSPAVVKLDGSLSSDSQLFVVIPHVFRDDIVIRGGSLAITTTNLAIGAAAGRVEEFAASVA